jgi:CDP-6-deoxy-D-xylo-4-hexulose-3-dehydrase
MEGGGIATNDSVLADDLRSMRAHGWSRDRSDSSDWNANLNKSDAKFRFITTGYNFRPTEVQAAIGINQISRIDEFVSRRREIVKSVSAACNSGPLKVLGREFLAGESSSRHAWMLIPIKIDCSIISRAKVIEILEDSGIETRPVLTGNFLRQPAMELYSSRVNADDYEVADWIAENCIVIGCHHDFTEAQVQHLVKVLSTI